MSLLPFELQEAFYSALNSDPLMTNPSAHVDVLVPALLNVAEACPADLEQWLQGVREHRTEEKTRFEAVISDEDRYYRHLPPVTEGLVAFDQEGRQKLFSIDAEDEYPGLPALVSINQLDGFLVLQNTWSAGRGTGTKIMATPGSITDYDTIVKVEHETYTYDTNTDTLSGPKISSRVYDASTEAVEDVDPFTFSDLGMVPYGEPRKRQKKLLRQMGSVTGDRGGIEFLEVLPQVVLGRLIASRTVDSEAFKLSYEWTKHSNQLEVNPLESFEVQEIPTVDIENIEGDLAFFQKDYRWNLNLVGSGIISGRPFLLEEGHVGPVPEGSIVMVDDEFGLNGLPPHCLAPAASVITRGYTGTRGIRLSDANRDHLATISRSFALERPGNFVYFLLPHINPDEPELKVWRKLVSTEVVTVASDGTDFKISAGDAS